MNFLFLDIMSAKGMWNLCLIEIKMNIRYNSMYLFGEMGLKNELNYVVNNFHFDKLPG